MQPLTWAEIRAWATQERIKGNEAYKVRDYKQALKKYDSALELDESDAEAFGNRAAVQMQLKQWTKAEADCSLALRLRPECLHHLGSAELRMSSYLLFAGPSAIALSVIRIELDYWGDVEPAGSLY